MKWTLLLLVVASIIFWIKQTLALVLIGGLLVGSLNMGIRELSLAHNEVARGAENQSLFQGSAEVKSDPHWTTSRVIGNQRLPQAISFTASTASHIPIRVISKSAVDFIPGDQIFLVGRWGVTKERKVAASLFLTRAPVLIHHANMVFHSAAAIRKKFRQQAIDIGGAGGALIPGLVIGDTSLESQKFALDMRRVGLSHLTAVSGANFAIIAALMLWVARWIFTSVALRLIFTSTFLLYFILLVRPSPSVLRASVMTAVLLIATWRGNRASSLPALGLAIGFLILIDPFQSIDAGFALSVAATAGILVLLPPITRFLMRFLFFPSIAELIAIPISATILCTPIIIAISGNFSLVTIPANLLAGIVVTPITIGGFVAAIIPPLAHPILILIKPLAQWIVLIADTFSSAPSLQLPMGLFGAVLVIFAIFLIYRFKWWAAISLVLIIPISIWVESAPWPGAQWVIANCDVGQGDGMAINLGNHRALVIDSGPDPLVMDKCLGRLGVTSIPLFVITHFHADHAGGASGVLKNRQVGQVWISNNPAPTSESAFIHRLVGSIPEVVVHSGERFSLGLVSIEVLWPGSTIGSSINNSSIALLITVRGLTIFAAGDIEPPAQSAIVASGKISHVDILKVAHHGSRYQDFALLDALSPKLAIISVGAGNTYGHPALITLQGLERRGVKILRTDRDGAISIDSSFKIRTQRKKWWMISWG